MDNFSISWQELGSEICYSIDFSGSATDVNQSLMNPEYCEYSLHICYVMLC